MILSYDHFMAERYKVTQNDKPEVADAKAHFNDIEAFITQFKTKKQELDNIYMTYKDNADLARKLHDFQVRLSSTDPRMAARVRQQANIKDMKKFEFVNPLFGIYSQMAAKKRAIKIKEMDIEKQTQTIEDRKKSSMGDEDLKASFGEDIDATNKKISGLKDEIKSVYQELADLERQLKHKLRDMREDFTRRKADMELRLKTDTTT